MLNTNSKILDGKYKLIRTIGRGASCKVKLGSDLESGRHVAIKIMKSTLDEKLKALIMNEVSAMDVLSHENIINQIEYGTGQVVNTGADGIVKNTKAVNFIVLELAEGGELFDFIANTGRFGESLARYFFIQFMNGLGYCHGKGVVHRDLKPENLLLDQFYNIKIADFGFAGPIDGRDGNGNLTTKLGTMNYMAPEIHLN